MYFRIIFGLAVLAWTTEIIAKNGVGQLYVDPVYHFKYPGFDWVVAWSGEAMHWQFYALAGSRPNRAVWWSRPSRHRASAAIGSCPSPNRSEAWDVPLEEWERHIALPEAISKRLAANKNPTPELE